jgi:hypothetical protein
LNAALGEQLGHPARIIGAPGGTARHRVIDYRCSLLTHCRKKDYCKFDAAEKTAINIVKPGAFERQACCQAQDLSDN